MDGRETDDDDTLERHTDTNKLTGHTAKIRARLRPGARAPVLRRLLPCASRRAPSGARPAAMPAAYTDDLAWRVVMRVHFFRQDVATVCDSRLGWACRGTT